MIAASAVALALVYLGVISIALVVIDVRAHRLPNAIVLPAYPVALALFGLAALVSGEWVGILRALAVGAVLFAVYAALRALPGGAVGGGDVKLAGVLGVYLGWFGLDTVLVAVLATFLSGGIVAGVLLITRRVERGSRIAFGPFMIGGAWFGIVLSLVAGR